MTASLVDKISYAVLYHIANTVQPCINVTVYRSFKSGNGTGYNFKIAGSREIETRNRIPRDMDGLWRGSAMHTRSNIRPDLKHCYIRAVYCHCLYFVYRNPYTENAKFRVSITFIRIFLKTLTVSVNGFFPRAFQGLVYYQMIWYSFFSVFFTEKQTVRYQLIVKTPSNQPMNA